MEYQIRRGVEVDAEALSRVHLASWRTTYGGMIPEAFFDQMERDLDQRVERHRTRLASADVGVWVAVTPENHVVGFADGGPIRQVQDLFDGELYAIYLLKGWQGLGVGKALVQHLAQYLSSRGKQAMAVWVLKDNVPARQFYERLGARYLTAQTIEIGSRVLEEWAYGWDDLRRLI